MRRGVTLLELILALALSILVLMTISMAINLHFRMLDIRRTNIEEAQVARVALKRIADDLRGIVQYTPPDLTGLEAILSSAAGKSTQALAGAMVQSGGGNAGGSGAAGGSGVQQSGASQSGGTSPGGQATTGAAGTSGSGQGSPGQAAAGGATGSAAQAGATGASTTGQLTGSTTGATTSTTTAAPTESVVGLIGTTTELRIDVSRLPRVDEYQGIVASGSELTAVDIPSDVKSVTYFILDEEASSAAEAVGVLSGAIKPSATGVGRGLMRSEMSRAVVAYAESNGDIQSAYDNARMLADEVVGIQFQYYDGTAWVAEWDSTTMGGLPKAVEIILTILPTYAMTEEALANLPPDAPPPEQLYRLVVHLPSAPLVAATSFTETSTTDTATAQGTSATAPAQGAMP
jgi:type II secretory pathway component PulJ